MDSTEMQQNPEGDEVSLRQDHHNQPQHLSSQQQFSDMSQQNNQLQRQQHQQQGFDDMIWDGKPFDLVSTQYF